MIVSAPISVGELIDKITILRIKRERILSPAKLKNIEQELQLLEEIRTSSGVPSLEAEEEQLYLVNNELWDIENYKRACEQDRRFDFLFIEAARNVYLKNDRRAEIKRAINLLTGSTIQEEKSY
jgi:Family of unknown function (DUF6165)